MGKKKIHRVGAKIPQRSSSTASTSQPAPSSAPYSILKGVRDAAGFGFVLAGLGLISSHFWIGSGAVYLGVLWLTAEPIWSEWMVRRLTNFRSYSSALCR